MSVRVDEALCSGCGICVEALPSVFAFNADGKAEAVSQLHNDPSKLEEVADQCPADAIEVSQD